MLTLFLDDKITKSTSCKQQRKPEDQPSQPYGHDVIIIVIIHCLLYGANLGSTILEAEFSQGRSIFVTKTYFSYAATELTSMNTDQNCSAINVPRAKCCICKLMLRITRRQGISHVCPLPHCKSQDWMKDADCCLTELAMRTVCSQPTTIFLDPPPRLHLYHPSIPPCLDLDHCHSLPLALV